MATQTSRPQEEIEASALAFIIFFPRSYLNEFQLVDFHMQNVEVFLSPWRAETTNICWWN